MRVDIDMCEETFITITRNKTRSLLTAFGVFWSIFMLIALVGGGQGMQDMMQAKFGGFATNSGFVGLQKTGEVYKGFRKGRYWDIRDSDVGQIREKVRDIGVIAPSIVRWGSTAIFGEEKYDCSVKGPYSGYAKIGSQSMAYGRFVSDVNVCEGRKACAIGKHVCKSLFNPGEDPCGEYVRVDGIYYQAIGMCVSEGNISTQGRASEAVVLPFSTVQQAYNMEKRIDVICYTVKPGKKVSGLEPEIESILKEAHYIAPGDRQTAMKLNAKAMFSMTDNLFTGIHVLIWMVGLDTLLTGAINVSNTMVVTVKERTTEMDIRRAIGARPKDILQQILSEDMVLTTITGMAGISFGVLILQLVEIGVNSGKDHYFHFQVSFGMVIGTRLLLVTLGLLAGLTPAYRAMVIHPIEAVRDK